MKMGLDSLMAIEVRNRITQTLALTIPLSSFFDEGCIASLASTIAGQVGHMVEGSIPASIRSTYIPEKTGTPPELRQAQPVQRNAGVNAPTEDVEGEL
jgi:hypothetical protein